MAHFIFLLAVIFGLGFIIKKLWEAAEATPQQKAKSDIEIERKYLVDINKVPLHAAKKVSVIKQGYIAQDGGTAVRVRTSDKGSYLTTKAKTDNALTRDEVEFEISTSNALRLLKLSKGYMIEKKRYIVTYMGQDFEVDVFEGSNSGLVLAELELNAIDQYIALPDWIIEDVSEDERYFNTYLSKHPFCTWKN
ncbi:CYTH domain-containing protein [Vibrio owensii]|uniref:CYTH domain-containing protein n=1 Tax=Vibrio harveyi group TaxID=717610 RepID=UPI003CC61B50